MYLPFLFDVLAVTPSDTQPLVRPAQGTAAQTNANPNFIGTGQTANPTKQTSSMAVAIACAVGGTVTVIDWLGNSQQLTLVAGFTYFFRFTQVKATGTAATGIMAFFPIME